MQNRVFVRLLLIVSMVLIGGATAAYALDDVSNMNCGDVIAEIGDQQFAFQQKCGPPTTTEENGRVWVYDRRPDDFVYYVTFSEGQVQRIQVSGDE
ncbi:MAG: DUF2845 domain-containing protein [Desulfobacterales bacterium]|jgi:hypothetical protein